MIDFKVARFELTDSDSDRFAIPDEIVERPEANKNMRLDMVGHFFNGTTKNNDQPFGFRFFDNVKPDSLYISTEDQSLIFSDKYIQMDFALPTNQVTGFGERITSHRLGDGAWGMWGSGTTDEDMTDNARGRGGKHGVHPFLLVRSTQAQKYIGMYFRNANAQLPIIRQDPQTKKTTLSYITLGGQIEVYFFISGTAKEVIQDYQRIFGKPQLPPFWAMGWH
jgi:alpha-glucosidase (family GH31 glycosyl hydrolase)